MKTDASILATEYANEIEQLENKYDALEICYKNQGERVEDLTRRNNEKQKTIERYRKALEEIAKYESGTDYRHCFLMLGSLIEIAAKALKDGE